MDCSVYQSKGYTLALLAFVLAFAVLSVWQLPRIPHDWGAEFMRWAFAVLISLSLVALIYALFRNPLAVRVDEAGIHYPRGWIPVIAWDDVEAVERAPKVERLGEGETQHHLRDAWRPLNITVRNPDRYLLRNQKAVRAALAPGWRPERTVIQIPFMGLTPGSDVVETCIRQHLARRRVTL